MRNKKQEGSGINEEMVRIVGDDGFDFCTSSLQQKQ